MSKDLRGALVVTLTLLLHLINYHFIIIIIIIIKANDTTHNKPERQSWEHTWPAYTLWTDRPTAERMATPH